jgi:hypothetical protein
MRRGSFGFCLLGILGIVAVGEPSHDENPVTVAHAYDVATFDGSDLWLVGSSERGYQPTAWRSTDGGVHWEIAHQLPSSGRY